MEGWISIYREIKDHWIWSDPVKFQWWIDILLTVNHKSKKINLGNDLIECNIGQSIMSLQNWGKRWNVSKDSARNFLKLLEKDGMITIENLKKTTRITVCKYESYQHSLHVEQTQAKRKPNASQTTTHPNNNDNNENNVNNENKTYKAFAHLKLSNNEFTKLNSEYTKQQIDDVLLNIENYRKNTNYKSLYLTCIKWLKKDHSIAKQTTTGYTYLTDAEKERKSVPKQWTYISYKDTYKKVHTDDKGEYVEDNSIKVYL